MKNWRFLGRRKFVVVLILIGLLALNIYAQRYLRGMFARGGMEPAQPAVTRTSGNITFSSAILADIQRTEAEPLNYIDKDGSIWASGPYGASTNNSFIQRSTDNGDQYNVVSPVGLRPDPPPGGGDTDVIVDDQGAAYFVDLEALANLGCAVSADKGNTWLKQAACVVNAAVDRQWFAVDNGSNHTIGAAGAADNTVFLDVREAALGSFIYSTPGSTGPSDTVGGLVYTPASSTPTAINSGAPCGQLRFDPVDRYLYLPCDDGDRVRISRGHVDPGQRTGIVFDEVTSPVSPGGGDTSELFPMVATDQAGTLYTTWVDSADQNLYYSYSTDHGSNWSTPVQINSAPSNAAIFGWPQGGTAGNLAIVWLGSDVPGDTDAHASWFASPPDADDTKWYVYTALITNANTSSPSIEQNRATQHPSHYGQICAAGTACSADPFADRVMAEYNGLFLEPNGAMRIIFNDVSTQYHGAHLMDTRQLSGPTALGTTISRPAAGNPVPDATNDAQWPHYSPTGPGANQQKLDFTRLQVSQPDANTLRFHMTVNGSLQGAPPTAPPGKSNAFLLTRFQTRSNADTAGAEAYRVFYVGVDTSTPGVLTSFAGSPDTVTGFGCTSTQTCKLQQYPAEMTGLPTTVAGNTVCVDVPLSSFGAARPIGQPINGQTDPVLYSVTAISGGRNGPTGADVYADVDATRSFNYTLGSAGPAPCALPTAAPVTVSGTVYDASGNGLRGAVVRLSDPKGNTYSATTNSFGYFRMDGVMSGESYMVATSRKGYVFDRFLVQIDDTLSGMTIQAR